MFTSEEKNEWKATTKDAGIVKMFSFLPISMKYLINWNESCVLWIYTFRIAFRLLISLCFPLLTLKCFSFAKPFSISVSSGFSRATSWLVGFLINQSWNSKVFFKQSIEDFKLPLWIFYRKFLWVIFIVWNGKFLELFMVMGKIHKLFIINLTLNSSKTMGW